MEPRRFVAAVAVAAMAGAGGAPLAQAAPVIKENGKTYIVDQRGERWDVTRAGESGGSAILRPSC